MAREQRQNDLGPEARKKDSEDLHILAEQRKNDRIRWMAPYIFMVVVGAFAFSRTDDATDKANQAAAQATVAAERATRAIERVDEEGLERDYTQCQAQNEVRSGILGFILTLSSQRTEELSEREQQYLDLAKETFGPIECPPKPITLE